MCKRNREKIEGLVSILIKKQEKQKCSKCGGFDIASNPLVLEESILSIFAFLAFLSACWQDPLSFLAFFESKKARKDRGSCQHPDKKARKAKMLKMWRF